MFVGVYNSSITTAAVLKHQSVTLLFTQTHLDLLCRVRRSST